MAPTGKSAVSAEVTYSSEFPVDPGTLGDRVVADLRTMGILSADDKVLFTDVMDMPCAYTIYDRERTEAVATIRECFTSNGVHCWGRYAEWAYQNMEANILSGKEAAELVGSAKS
jgi:UDP-galactopyranose mutase